jgi:hypothetical protein
VSPRRARRQPAQDEGTILLEILDNRIQLAAGRLAWLQAAATQPSKYTLISATDLGRLDHRLDQRTDNSAALAAAADELTQLKWARGAAASLVRKARMATSTRPAEDEDGVDLRPDPARVTTAAEMGAALRAYRAWAGDPSFRTMAAASGQKAAASTICVAMGRDELPRLEVVIAVIAGCGGSQEELRRWATAWRRLRGLEDAGVRAAEVRELRAVPDAATG